MIALIESNDMTMNRIHWKKISEGAKFQAPRVALFAGDARDILRRIPDGSIDTCVTSPPYWAARDYGSDGEIGSEKELEDYISSIGDVFDEMFRTIKSTGSVWLNLGDKYLNGIGTVKGRPPRYGWKRNKQLSLVPFRVALELQERGWWLRNTIVWHKPNGMPISASDRLANHWEPVFLFTKSEEYFFDLDAVREPHKTSDHVERSRAVRGANKGVAAGETELRKWLNSPRHRATIDGLRDIERRPNAPAAVVLAAYLKGALTRKGLSIGAIAAELGQPFERVRHYFRLDEIGSRLPPNETWVRLKALLDLDDKFDDAMAVELGDNAFRNHPKGRNPGDVKQFSVGVNESGHYATMPRKLANWCLKATLPLEGVAIDPFMGSGTTGIETLSLGGKFVGIDLSEKYVSGAWSRLKAGDEPPLADAAE